MKNSRFNLFAAAVLAAISTTAAFAVDRVRNGTANALNLDAAWDTVAPGSSDRAVWNGSSVGGATTLGGNGSWQGILISSGTPTSGPSFTNVANPSAFTLTLGSSGIDLNVGGVTNRGISFESNTSLALGANQTWKLGDGQTSANIVVSSVVSGASSLEITRASGASNYAQLGGLNTGLNTFSGGLTVGSNAWLRLANTNAATTNLIAVTASPTGTTTLTLGNGALVSSDGSGSRTIANTQINLLGDVTFNQATGGTGRIQVAGVWDLGGAARTITVNRPAVGYASQEGVAILAPSGFVAPRFQNGALSLATTSGTTSNPAILRFNTSAFTSNGSLTVGDGVAITSQNGAFFSTGIDAPALTLAAPDTRGGGILQLGDTNATMRTATVFSLAGGGLISGSNTTTSPVQTGTVTVNNGNGATFSGNISEGGTGIIAFTKSGTGTQTLSGTNTYTGKTTISTSGGVLKFAKQVSLYNNTPASWTDTNIQVDSGTTLALNVGGTGEFTSSNIATLTALGTATGGFRSGSRLGLDTTNAGGTFTYGNVLANPNGGTNTLGLRKLGSGTLLLDQVNTFTGGTTIEGGTLKVTQPGALGGGGTVTVSSGTSLVADFSALGAAGTIGRAITGVGTIDTTPANTFQLSFSSTILTTFTGIINVKASPASNGRVDFNGLLGNGSIVNVENGATARLAAGGTYSGVTVNVTGTGGSGPGALRLEAGTLDSSCAVNLTGNASIGGFTVTSTVDAVIADGVNDYSLTKSGNSTLALTAVNTYSGGTNVTGGTLRISKPYLANAAPVTIAATGAVLDLNFDETSGQVTDTVATLTIGVTQMAAGVYGATGSGAAIIDDTHFAGIGTLTVTSGPAGGNYASWAIDNNIPGEPASGDFDLDGLSNLMEYGLGKNPTLSSVPGGSFTPPVVTFTKGSAAIANGDVSWVIQKSTDLAIWTNEVTQAAGDPALTISYSLPPNQPRVFTRLRVVKP